MIWELQHQTPRPPWASAVSLVRPGAAGQLIWMTNEKDFEMNSKMDGQPVQRG